MDGNNAIQDGRTRRSETLLTHRLIEEEGADTWWGPEVQEACMTGLWHTRTPSSCGCRHKSYADWWEGVVWPHPSWGAVAVAGYWERRPVLFKGVAHALVESPISCAYEQRWCGVGAGRADRVWEMDVTKIHCIYVWNSPGIHLFYFFKNDQRHHRSKEDWWMCHETSNVECL